MSPNDHDHIRVGDLVSFRGHVGLIIRKSLWATIVRWICDSSEEDLFNYNTKDIGVF